MMSDNKSSRVALFFGPQVLLSTGILLSGHCKPTGIKGFQSLPGRFRKALCKVTICAVLLSLPPTQIHFNRKAPAMTESSRSVVRPTLCSDSVTQKQISKPPTGPVVDSPGQSDAQAFPLGFLLGPKSKFDREVELQSDSLEHVRDRILSRMALQEAKEPNPHYRADRRIAEIIVIMSLRGESDALNKATYAVLNCYSDQVWPSILKNRKDKLGAEYSDWFDAAGNLRPDLPKIESASAPKKPAASTTDKEVA